MHYHLLNKQKQKLYVKVPENISIYEYVVSNNRSAVVDFLRKNGVSIVDVKDLGELCYKLYQFALIQPDLTTSFIIEIHPDKDIFTKEELPKVKNAEGDAPKVEVKETPQPNPIPQANKYEPLIFTTVGIGLTLLLINTIINLKK